MDGDQLPRPAITAPHSEDWAGWRGAITQMVQAIPKSIDDLRASNKESLEALRRDFKAVVAGEVECKVGQRLRRVEGRVWKTILLAFTMPLLVALIIGLVVHYR